ncbi:unnamed protein product [Sympodiomycopsis kandeliae]
MSRLSVDPSSTSFRYGPPPPLPSGRNSYQSQPQELNLPSLAGEGIQTLNDFILSLPHPRYWPGLLLEYMVLDPIRRLISSIITLITSPTTHRVVLRLSVLASLFWSALVLAILASIGFHKTWVPNLGRTENVHLQYGTGEIPSAIVNLGNKEWFAEEQEYDISVDILVPISNANLDLGNFMVSVHLITKDDMVVFSSSRPTILRPSTPSVRFLSQVANHVSRSQAMPLPLPFTSPSLELMTVTVFDRLIIHPSKGSIPFSNPGSTTTSSNKITKAVVKIGRSDADRYWIYGGGHGIGGVVLADTQQNSGDQPAMMLAGGNGAYRSRGELQTVGVGIRFDARLQGLRWFMYTHPILSFLLFTTLFMAFELTSAVTLWTIAAVYTSSLPGLDVDLSSDAQYIPLPTNPSDHDDDDDDDDEDPRYATLRRRRPASSTTTSATATPFEGLTTSDDETLSEPEQQQPPPPSLPLQEELLPSNYRRVLGRLDEETEEETDIGAVQPGSDNEEETERESSTSSRLPLTSEEEPTERVTPSASEDSQQ